MAEYVWDKTFGERYEVLPSGELRISPELSSTEALMVGAGAHLNKMGRGIRNIFTPQNEMGALREEAIQQERDMAAFESAYPVEAAIGSMLPALATAPLTFGASVGGSIAGNAALGAVENMLTFNPNTSSQAIDFAVGGLTGAVGDVGGRMAGRLFNFGRGLNLDNRARMLQDKMPIGEPAAVDDVAREFQAFGGRTLPSQRMARDDPSRGFQARMEEGAESSFVPMSIFNEVAEDNQGLTNRLALEAIGLKGEGFENLAPDALGRADQLLTSKFDDIATRVGDSGDFILPQEVVDSIAGAGQINELVKKGRFKGLESGLITGNEWNTARRALASDAARAAKNGKYELAEAIGEDIRVLDDMLLDKLPANDPILKEFAEARDQYNMLRVMQKSGVVKDGDVSVRSLNNRLRSDAGYGKTARLGTRDAPNTESQRLIDYSRVASDSSLQRRASSGTAERSALDNAAEAVGDVMGGNLTQLARLAAPIGMGISTAGGGRAIQGLATAAPPLAGALGGVYGRGLLDEQLFPFIGSEDDRR